MRVKIYKNQLLRQLPDSVRILLVASFDLPDVFEFDAFETMPDVVKKEEIPEEYRAVYEALSPMQWYIFFLLTENREASASILGKYSRGQNLNNTIASHIVALNKRLARYGFPYRIETARRGGVGSDGTYKLIRY